MALGVVLPAFYAEKAYVDANTDVLGQKCNFCSDAPFPPIALPVQITNPQHVQGIKTIKLVLDWSGKLYNIQGLGLRKAIEAIITWQVIKNVKKGAILGAKGLVETQITRGYVQPNTTLSTRDTPANNTDPAFQYMNSSIDITATSKWLLSSPTTLTRTCRSSWMECLRARISVVCSRISMPMSLSRVSLPLCFLRLRQLGRSRRIPLRRLQLVRER
jgi:hypothetical protein